MSNYDSEDDSSSEEKDEWYKRPKSTDESSESWGYYSGGYHRCKLPFKSVADFQWCLFKAYDYGHVVNDVEECHKVTQVGWKKGFHLFSRFLKHKTGCDVEKFLSKKHPFDARHDDTGCLHYAKNGKSRIHIHKMYDYDDAEWSTIDVRVNEDLSFRAAIRSNNGFHRTVISEKRVPKFKRRMRLSSYHNWLRITEDCHFARHIDRTWKNDRRTCRKLIPVRFKKKSKPPEYAKCKDKSRHQKASESNENGKQIPAGNVFPMKSMTHIKSMKKKLPQKKLPKTINKKSIFKNAVKGIQKKAVQKPTKLTKQNDNEVKQKSAPIGDRLGPDH
ncbi:hypothetical protein Ddc_12142 [Ditylenchus destructor]|nr:hypothetical protein Ddc_12142 [Ditylenchus destructor]